MRHSVYCEGTMLKLCRTLRLDQSDLRIFPQAAEPGEWAVPGTFAFLERNPAAYEGKERLAFSSGWLGCETFGRSTLVEVAEVAEADYFAVVEHLARHFVEHYGAPDLGAALPAAREEVDHAASLAQDHKIGTLLAMERHLDDAYHIRERYRVILPSRSEEHARIWTLVEDEPDEKP